MDRLNVWLNDFGWTLNICGEERNFKVTLESNDFETEVMNELYWKDRRNYFPEYMDM